AAIQAADNDPRPRWQWGLAAPALKLKSGDKIVLRANSDGMSLDQIALSSDPNFDPEKSGVISGPVTLAPQPVTGVEAFDIAPQSLKLRWKASPALNIARYDIHALGNDGKVNGNTTIIASTRDTNIEDWGLRPGTAYQYAVVAVDSRGNVSPPALCKVTTAQQTVQTITSDVEAAERDARITMLKSEKGVPLATLPKQDDASAAKGPAKITYTFEVKEEAPFMLWAQYRPAYVPGDKMSVAVELDGKPAGNFQMRHPYAPLAFGSFDGGKRPERIWTDKIVLNGADVFTLSPGKHTVTIVFDPKVGELQHAFGTITISNDHSLRPAGYDPRANFLKKWY
ncbi:MAG TPA: fibronectin type III domain-containing protein, partial [Planctomycetota bacterium]|nr:fibronectin type III domain-containing protein [Planctomycetota bacterium]